MDGSWWGLVAVLEQSRQEFEALVSIPPVAGPVDGEPLASGPVTASGAGAELFCRHDGWRYPRDWVRPVRL